MHTPHRRDTRKWSDDYCTRTRIELELGITQYYINCRVRLVNELVYYNITLAQHKRETEGMDVNLFVPILLA